MQTPHRLPIPIQIRQQQEPLLPVFAIHDVFLLGPAFDDVEHPIQRALFPLPLHVRTNILCVDVWRLGDQSHALCFVLADVFLRARVDEIEFEVWRGGAIFADETRVRIRQEPGVDVVCAEVLDVAEGRGEGGEGAGRCVEGSALGD
jgi:hypothetical protein